MKRSVIDAHMKHFLYYDETDEVEVEFKKIWLKCKKQRTLMPDTVERIESRPGMVGSGRFVYKFKNEIFTVNGHANGNTFWGTDFYISKNKA
jgi:hypothetical protein